MDPQSPHQAQIPTRDYKSSESDEDMEVSTTPRARRGSSESPPRQGGPRSPNLYRLVPVSDNMSEASVSSTNSPDPERPADMPRMYFVPGMNLYPTSSSPESREPSTEPRAITDGRESSVPAEMPPETPASQLAETPQEVGQSHTPLPSLYGGSPAVRMPRELPRYPHPSQQQQQSVSPADFKIESPDIVLMGPPTPMPFTPRPGHTPQSSDGISPPTGSNSQQGLVNSSASRRRTRGSLAAAAAAATVVPEAPRAPTPEPGAPVQASITVWIITQDKTWLLPQPQLGVSLAQTVPPDFEPPAWMKYTRTPILWDGKTDAGGKSGKNLVLIGAAAAKVSVNGRLVTPTRSESVDAEQSPTSPISSSPSLDGLHLLMDFKSDEKPTYSYALMTRFAILGSPYKSLSLGEIYTMIESKFPWFARDESKWRDSIRYNLSSNCWFVKTKRALHQPGVGNLWMVDEASPGGPKRPRKGRGKGSAFTEDDEEEGSGDEPGPSIISSVDGMDPALLSPESARNGTLMLTFDSKAKVPLDKEAGQRGVTAHASHNLIPRIVTRHIVMNAVDQAFANAPDGQEHVDPREHVVQAINNMPFSLSNDDLAEATRKSKIPARKTVTRASANGEPGRNTKISPKKIPAPPWEGGPSTGDEGIGSGRDEDESDEDEEGHTPDDYWLTDNNDHDVGNMEPEAQPSSRPGSSRGVDVDMSDRSTSTPSHALDRRPSAPVDVSGLERLSDAALGTSQARPAPSFLDAQRAKSPDVLIRGRELSPRIINNVLVRRRQANVIDADAFLRQNTRPPQPLAPAPAPTAEPAASLIPPTFASLLNSTQAGTSAGGPSGTTNGGSWQSGSAQQAPGFQPGMFRPARPRQGDGTPTAFDRSSSSNENPTSSAAGRRPQLARLAPAATSSAAPILDPGRNLSAAGLRALRIPGTRQTPPQMRRPLTPNRGDMGSSSGSIPTSPYAPPPDSRKRKHIPQSPDSARVALGNIVQKARRIDTDGRRGPTPVNPMFSLGQASSSTSSTTTLNPGHGMPPPPAIPFRPASAGGTPSTSSFLTATTSKTSSTPFASGSGQSSVGPSTSRYIPVPAFGQSGFMFKSGLGAGRGSIKAKGSQASGSRGNGINWQAFMPKAPSTSLRRDSSGDKMELDSGDELSDDGGRRRQRGRHSSSRMETDGSDEETSGNAERRDAAVRTRDVDLYRGLPPARGGVFAQVARNRGLSLTVSAPTSSSRTDSGVPIPQENAPIISPTSASRDSPILAPIAHASSRGSTESPRLPSITSLLRQSPAPEPHDSLPPIQNRQTASPVPTQMAQPPTLPVSASISPSTPVGISTVQPQPTSAFTFYYGFLMTSRPSNRPATLVNAKYTGGNDDDSAAMNGSTSDWRD